MTRLLVALLFLTTATVASADVLWRAHWSHPAADYALTNLYVAEIVGLGDFDLGKPPRESDGTMKATVALPTGTVGPLSATVRAEGDEITSDPSNVKIIPVMEPPEWAGTGAAVLVLATLAARRR